VLSVPFVIITGLLKISGCLQLFFSCFFTSARVYLYLYLFVVFHPLVQARKSKENEFPVKKTALFSSAFYSIGTAVTMPKTGWCYHCYPGCRRYSHRIHCTGLGDFYLLCFDSAWHISWDGIGKNNGKKITHLLPFQGFCARHPEELSCHLSPHSVYQSRRPMRLPVLSWCRCDTGASASSGTPCASLSLPGLSRYRSLQSSPMAALFCIDYLSLNDEQTVVFLR